MNRREFVAGLLGTAAVAALAVTAVRSVAISPRQPMIPAPNDLGYVGCVPDGAHVLDLARLDDKLLVLAAEGPYLFDGRAWEPVVAVKGEQYRVITNFTWSKPFSA